MTPAKLPLDTGEARQAFWPPRLGAILTYKLCRGCKTLRLMPRSFHYCSSCTAPQRVRQLQREAEKAS